MEGIRAKDEIRTRDPDLGKVVLYQLSYFRIGISSPTFSLSLLRLRECKYRQN
jgi:hypothetical protein